MQTPSRRALFKTGLFTLLVIVCQVGGNALLSWAMKRDDVQLPALFATWLPLAAHDWMVPFFSLFLWLGVAMLVVSLLSRMTLLSWADLSFVAPVTALGYVLNVAAGAIVLGEVVDAKRWAGSLLVVAGSALVGITLNEHGPAPQTQAEAPPVSGNHEAKP